MGKTVAYVATAILLGVVAMLPVMVFTPKRADQGYIFDGDMRVLRSDVESYSSETVKDIDVAAAPSGPFHTVLIMVVSFVCAFGVSFYFRRRMF
jgi:hypothetical protein